MNRKHARQYDLFRESVLCWYTPERWFAVYPYITGEKFSRRFIEHFITEYARCHRCVYPLTDPFTGEVTQFNVFHAAQTVLAGVHKRNLDPFGRRQRGMENGGVFSFGYGTKRANVTVCELVFFRWALKHKVLEYAETHYEEIRRDMTALSRLRRNALAAGDDGQDVVPQRIQEIRIELSSPPPQEEEEEAVADSAGALVLAPPQFESLVHRSAPPEEKDEYWLEATRERKQQPKKRRKRYRNGTVNMMVDNDCNVKSMF